MSETELIIAFNNRDKTAFSIIYKRLYPDVYAFAKKYVTDEDAVDITADVFINLFKSRESFQGYDNIKAWLIRVVRNACLNTLSKEKNKLAAHKEIAIRLEVEEPAWQTDQEHAEIAQIYFSLIKEAIAKLPEQKQTIFRLAFMNGLKNGEIASMLSLDERKIRNTKTRMISFLREVLTEKGVATFLFMAAALFQSKE